MSINAYPLIHSRTRNSDFIQGFLVQPDFFENDTDIQRYCYVKASDSMHYIENTNNVIRNVVFTKGDYVICGVSCTTPALARICNIKEKDAFPDSDRLYEYYLRDEVGRKIQCFIGLVFNISDIVASKSVPKIDDLKVFLDLFFKYTRNQWERKSVHTESISEPISMESIQIEDYRNLSKKVVNSKAYIFEEDIDKVMEYSFSEILSNTKDEFSLIYRMIDAKEDLQDTSFKEIVTTKTVFESMQSFRSSKAVDTSRVQTTSDEGFSNYLYSYSNNTEKKEETQQQHRQQDSTWDRNSCDSNNSSNSNSVTCSCFQNYPIIKRIAVGTKKCFDAIRHKCGEKFNQK